jgi:crotonobetaine/carnitine-CoA ligase
MVSTDRCRAGRDVTSGMPDASDVVLRALLERNAAAAPDRRLVAFEDGTTWTNAEALAAAYTAGNALRALGVCRGDAVALFLPNGPEFLRAWWGACAIGAVVVPVNLAFRGPMLEHLLRTAGCAAVVVDAERADRLDELGYSLGRVDPASLVGGGDSDPPKLDAPIEPWDLHLLLMTSGTTGPSKVSRTTYWHVCLGEEYLGASGFGADDVFLVDLPLFHAGGLYSVMVSLAVGARFVVRAAPALGSYWETARELGVTTAVLVSSMITFLQAQPPRASDTDHRLHRILSIPMPHDAATFMARFGVARMVTGYGSTEVPAPIVARTDRPIVADSCGQPRDGFEVRLVDAHDVEVPDGEVGEAIVRTELPWMMSQGYENNDEATVAAWRNGWFHTGDLLRRDADGNYYFVDRASDSLRRRGENISTFEVEAQVAAFPGVAAVACVAARCAEHIDDEVKVWVVPAPGAVPDPAELLRFCADRMPHFMVPRYIEHIDELPKTPSAKVRKYLLRERGNSAATWDREEHGLRMTRDGLVEQP